jgi:hypothetical protein
MSAARFAEPLPRALDCPATFSVAEGFAGSHGPRLWVWWTAPTRAAWAPEDSGKWLMRELAAARALHASSAALTVAIVNSSVARDPASPLFLKRFPLPAYFDTLPVNHQGDFGSIAFLAEFGGLYLDADVLVLSSLRPYFDLLSALELVGFGHNHDGGLHHGLLLARPRSALASRAYAAALSLYARVGGCSGAACAHAEAIPFYDTVNALSGSAEALRASGSATCAFARLPTRHFEPVTCSAPLVCDPKQGLCSAGLAAAFKRAREKAAAPPGAELAATLPDADACFLAALLRDAFAGVIRVLHLSNTKKRYLDGHPGDTDAAHCPLLSYLVDGALGRVGEADASALVRAAADLATGCWRQQIDDFSP